MTSQAPPKWLEIDKFVEAFEQACASSGEARMADFLPARDHPFFIPILCELVRVDLELAWVRGQPRGLEEYLAAFPCLKEDRESLQDLAFEHFRQRGQHGEHPAREEYQGRFGVDTRLWPSVTNGRKSATEDDAAEADAMHRAAVLVKSSHGEIEAASLAYEKFRAGPDGDNAAALRFLWSSRNIPPGVAELFDELHASDPQAAWRLARATTALPEAGEAFLDFMLLAEVGRGAFGRVYLARQLSLADRLVVLKISTDLTGESRMLAQLQHTNIVPIYSVHQASPLQAVCMPYFGATTLADVLRELRGLESLPLSGMHLVTTLHGRQASTLAPQSAARAAEAVDAVSGSPTSGYGSAIESSAVSPVPLAPDTLDKLAKSSYIDAVLWLGKSLAEGLAHAHARGIFHHDLKPANVLFSDDGQPMLLDFNLAEDTKLRRSAAAIRVGGTLPYMAPEQLAAFQGGRLPVDARSDVYSLGLILFELLTARHAFPTPSGPLDEVLSVMQRERRQPAPRLRSLNSAVTPAVEAIVRRCLAAAPDARYQTAGELREDLERQLSDQPLRHAAEPSWRERFGKWRRRHPKLASVSSVCLISAVLLAGLASMVVYLNHRIARRDASAALADFLDEKRSVEVLVSIASDHRDPIFEFHQQARELLARYEVDQPDWRQNSAVRNLASGDQQRLFEEIGNLSFFLARAEIMAADRATNEVERQAKLEEARRWNQAAWDCFDDELRPAAVEWQRDELARRLDPSGARPVAGGETHAPRTARDAYLLAFDLCAQERYAEALPLVERAVRNDPGLFVAHFLHGRCHLYLGQDVKAEQAFDICVALWPEFHWSYFNRGIVRHRLGWLYAAREDFDHVLALKPDLAEAYIERGQVRQGARDFAGAIGDFNSALEHGAAPASIHFLQARAHGLAGDAAAADRAMREGLRHEPRDEQGFVARGLARLPHNTEAALADFDAALAINPRSRPARQNKAYVLSELQKKIEESIAVLDDVLADYPEYLPSLGGRGVLLARFGRRDAAHADAKACLRLSNQPETLYQMAGLYALTSRQTEADRAEALRLLAASLAESAYGLQHVNTDADLDPLREDAEFQRIVAAAKYLRGKAAASAGATASAQ